LSISTGMMSKPEKRSAAALAEPSGELTRSVLEAEAVHIDETWRVGRVDLGRRPDGVAA
jgi:hypothetical protein